MPSGFTEDLSGQEFGRLILIEKLIQNKKTYYLCECSCNNRTRKLIRADSIKNGSVVSCGCYNKENVKELHKYSITHGLSNTRIYKIYRGMKNRCYNIKDPSYADYGGRRIIICSQWLKNFVRFYNWSIENGYEDHLTIERKDVNGNYEPSNCKWATMNEQLDNKTNTLWITIDGVTKTCRQWDREYGLPKGTAYQRYNVTGVRGKDLLVPIKEKSKYQSGVMGITWHNKSKKWRFAVNINKKKKHMGYFENLEDAISAKEVYEKGTM